jgi:hypothetical protein
VRPRCISAATQAEIGTEAIDPRPLERPPLVEFLSMEKLCFKDCRVLYLMLLVQKYTPIRSGILD